MNYIYDIYLNLNNTLYDFFEWNKNDKLTHIKKIPIFKISNEKFKLLLIYNIKFDIIFLNEVYNQSEMWNKIDKIEFCALFCDDNNVIALELNNEGYSIKKSFLMLEEEFNILEIIDKIKVKNINFKLINKEKKTLKTRNQIKSDKFIEKELKNITTERLKYIFFECFGQKCNNKNLMLKNINKILNSDKMYENLYDILKLTSTTKNKMI